VPVDLIVRGICCLRPGIPGISDNIRVRSIVGRFLEHSRIFWFQNGGQEEMFIGSADLMERNLERRVETLAPIRDPEILEHLRDVVLGAYLRDTDRAMVLDSAGKYDRPADSAEHFNSQRRIIPCKFRPIADKHDPGQCRVAAAEATALRRPPVHHPRIEGLVMDITIDQPRKATHIRFHHGDHTAGDEHAYSFTQEGFDIRHMVEHIDHHQGTERRILKRQSFSIADLVDERKIHDVCLYQASNELIPKASDSCGIMTDGAERKTY